MYYLVGQSRSSVSFYPAFIYFIQLLSIHKYVVSNYHFPGTVQIAGAESVDKIDKTPVLMERQKRKDSYNWTLKNREDSS